MPHTERDRNVSINRVATVTTLSARPQGDSSQQAQPPTADQPHDADQPHEAEALVTDAPVRGRWWMTKFVLLLGSMCAIGAFTVDTYLPSLPEVAADLGTTAAAAQFTITATLLGGALGQGIIGPLSDRYGRRAPVMIGLIVHIVASLLCIVVVDIVPLVVLRIIQGIGNAAAGVTALAVLRDRLTGPAASAAFSRLMLVIGVAPLLAPTLGGAIAHMWNWRAVFGFLALFGLALLIIVWRFLPETLPVERRLTSTRQVVSSYRHLVRDGRFVAFALLPGLAMAALFSYVAASPFVIREGYGLTEGQFAGLFAVIGLGLVIGAQVNAAMVRRFAPIRLLRVASVLVVVMAAVLFAMILTGTAGLVGIVVPLWLMCAFSAFIAPNASALAMQRHGDRAGAAAALIGVSQAGIAGIMAPLVSVLGGDARAMGIMILVSMTLALGVLASTGAFRRGGWSAATV